MSMAAARCVCGRRLLASSGPNPLPPPNNFFELVRRRTLYSSAAPLAPAAATKQAAPAASGHPSRPGQLPPKPKPVSSVPAGTPLKGVRIIKGVEDPVAKEDSEYPEWLWSLADEDMGVGRTDSPIRAMRRQLNKQNTDAIRAANFLKDKRK